MKITAICDEDTAVGLRFAGIKEVYTPDRNIRELFREITERDDVGILFLTEDIANSISRDLHEYLLQKREFPIVVEIPDKRGHRSEYIDHVSMLIKRAVGIDIERKAL